MRVNCVYETCLWVWGMCKCLYPVLYIIRVLRFWCMWLVSCYVMLCGCPLWCVWSYMCTYITHQSCSETFRTTVCLNRIINTSSKIRHDPIPGDTCDGTPVYIVVLMNRWREMTAIWMYFRIDDQIRTDCKLRTNYSVFLRSNSNGVFNRAVSAQPDPNCMHIHTRVLVSKERSRERAEKLSHVREHFTSASTETPSTRSSRVQVKFTTNVHAHRYRCVCSGRPSSRFLSHTLFKQHLKHGELIASSTPTTTNRNPTSLTD